jgi:uncharacterized protein YqfB (UPF0267 family)
VRNSEQGSILSSLHQTKRPDENRGASFDTRKGLCPFEVLAVSRVHLDAVAHVHEQRDF